MSITCISLAEYCILGTPYELDIFVIFHRLYPILLGSVNVPQEKMKLINLSFQVAEKAKPH